MKVMGICYRLCNQLQGSPVPRYYTPANTEVLFWKKVYKTNGGCWLWAGSILQPGGYGHFHVKRKGIGAHVYSFELHHGPVPEGHVVRHSCNSPSCVNPDHLSSGTQKQNIADAVSQGRHCHGESHGNSVITDASALRIKELLAKGRRASDIACLVGTTVHVVYDIKRGRTWRHVCVS
jgi:hypothetical protein